MLAAIHTAHDSPRHRHSASLWRCPEVWWSVSWMVRRPRQPESARSGVPGSSWPPAGGLVSGDGSDAKGVRIPWKLDSGQVVRCCQPWPATAMGDGFAMGRTNGHDATPIPSSARSRGRATTTPRHSITCNRGEHPWLVARRAEGTPAELCEKLAGTTNEPIQVHPPFGQISMDSPGSVGLCPSALATHVSRPSHPVVPVAQRVRPGRSHRSRRQDDSR